MRKPSAAPTLRRLLAPPAVLACVHALSVPAPAQQSEPAAQAGAAEPDGDSEKKEGTAPQYQEVVEVEGEAVLPATSSTALRVPLPLPATPVSVSVVPRQVMDDQAASFMGDALRNAAGANVGTGFGVFDYFVIRGFDSLSSGLVLTDGAPEPESTFYPVYNVRRVEVLKGPVAFLYGGSSLAGAVHLVRKQPQAGRFADVGVSYGRFGTVEGTLDGNVGRQDGSLALRWNALYRGSDGYRDGKDSSVVALNPTLSWRPDERTRLAVNLEYVRNEFQPDTGLPVVGARLADVPRTRSFQSPFDFSEQDVYRLRLDLERRVSPRLTLRNKLYYTELDWRSDGTLLNGAFPNAGGGIDVARTLTLLDDRQRLLGNQAEASFSFSSGPVRHEVLAGFEASRLADDYALDVAALPGVGLFDPIETAQRPLFILPGLSQRADARAIVLAPYLADRIGLGDQVELFIGGRLDALDYEDTATSTARDHTKLSPMCGVTWRPDPGLTLYGSAGTAFAPPSTQVVGPRDPEESRQIEIGVKKSFLGKRGLATLAVYHLERDNIAIPDAGGLLRQAGDQRSQGFELELTADGGGGWLTTASYAFNDAELTRFTESVLVSFQPPAFALLDRSGNAPAFAPRHLLNLWSRKVFRSGVEVGVGARYVGGQFIAEDNAFAIDDYLLLDAMVGYRRGPLRWSLNLKNLADREYATRGFASSSAIPADPFAVYGRVELAFGSR